ncbi:hypothetical protein N9998_00465 [Nitrosopumilus sp.]|nr:hypothetical protein [Nitrosopumilus sp.]
MGRSRTGTSAINRRKFVAKAKTTSSSSSSQPAPAQTSSPNIVPASKTVSSAGLVVAAPGASDRAQGKRPVSSDIAGREIQVDEEGRMKLDEIEKKNFLEQLFRGSVVPTEQMVGVVKDVAYGVSSEDQRTMESGLDLVLNPLMKPFVDERMETEGVISDEWYWPEELKSTWNVLPGFMQKSDTVEKRSFFDGVSANVGNIGAISQSELGHKIRDEEFAVSGERFERAPGYYIGSALGEIPYFIIGAGQVKAVGTVAAKATAGVVRGGGVVNTAKMMSTAYKLERATEKLQKVANKLDAKDRIDQSKIISKPEVLRAVKLLKDGYATNVRVQKKDWKYDMDVKAQVKTVNEKVTGDSKILNKFTAKKMDKIEALPEKTELQRTRKKAEIDAFNADVQEYLLPNMRQFKEGYVAQAVKTASDTKVERLATAIGGSPKNMSKRMDDYFNKRRKDKGDTDKSNEQFFRDEMSVREAKGEFAGVMGNIKFNKYLFGNTMNTILGISRTQKKAGELISLVQRSTPNVRIVTKDQLLSGVRSIEDDITLKKKEAKEIKMETKRLEAKLKNRKYGTKSQPVDNVEVERDLELVPNWTVDAAGEGVPGKPIKIKDRIAENKERIEEISRDISVARQTIDKNKAELVRALAYTKPKGKPKKDMTAKQKNVFRFDYDIFQKAYGDQVKLDTVIPSEIIMASKPSVSVRRVKGRWEGQIGDTPETSKSFIIDQITRDQAQNIYGPEYVSKNPSVFKSIGLRRVGRFRTLVPKKAEPMEDVVYMYEATDAYRAGGFTKSGVKPVVVMNRGLSVKDQSLRKKEYGLDVFTGDQKVGQAISGGKERTILEYKQISNEDIKTIKQGGTVKMDGDDVGDILINRAELENRQAEFDFFAERKITAIEAEKNNLNKLFDEKIKGIQKNKRTGKKKKIEYEEKARKENDMEIIALENRQKSLKLKMDTPWHERRQTEIGLQIHRTADQRGSITSFPLQVLKRSSESYGTRYESSMVRSKSTGKDYYLSQAADGTTDYYEVLDDSFRPSMVSSVQNKAKKPKGWNKWSAKKKRDWVGKQVLLATRETVYPKDIGPDTLTPFRPTGMEENYIINVMQKGTRIKFVGSDTQKWNVALKQYEPQGRWVDAKDPEYQMGLDFEEVMSKGNLPEGIIEPDGSKGFVITNKKTGKVKWDNKPKELDRRGKTVGQKTDDKVKKVTQNTVSYRLASQMRENLLFLDPDIKVTTRPNFIGPSRPVPYEGILKKLTPDEKAVLESGDTIGSRQSSIQNALAGMKTTDVDLFLDGGRKLTKDEKILWKRTGKLSTDKDAPYYTMDYGNKSTPTLIKQNVDIVSAKGMLRALQVAKDTRNKLKTKAFGQDLVPIEVKSLAPDRSTYNQFTERSVARIPYGDAVRTTGFEDDVAALFAVSQSDSMVQGKLPGGVRVTPVQEVLPTTHIINEKPLTVGDMSMGKGLDANKGSNYDRMLAQAKGKDSSSFGGGTVERDFKKRMVEQIYSKVLKKPKPKADVMNEFLEPESVQYSKLIDATVRTNNSNLKRMSKKEAIKLKVKNKGRKEGAKKAVINPDDFEDILGKVNLDTRNPIRRLSDAFKYRTQYRTEPEVFKEGTSYTVDGKTSSQYKASKTDRGTNIKQPSWFGKLAIGIGSKRKNNVQYTENTNPFQIQALKDVFKEPWVQQYIGKDKTITKLYDDVMGRGETIDEAGLQAIIKAESDPANMARNVELNKLLGRLEATQLRLDKRIDNAPPISQLNPQWILDSNINAKKIKIVKDQIKEGVFDVARQSDADEWDFVNRKFLFNETGNIKKIDPKPRNVWGKDELDARRPDSIGEESQDTLFNISDDIWKAPGQGDERLRLRPSEKENVLEPFIEGTKPSSTVSPVIRSLDEARDKTRSFLMTSVGIDPSASTSISRRSLGKEVVNFMEETFEKSKQKQAKNVINTENPVDSLSAFLADPENASKFDTPGFQKASQKLDIKQDTPVVGPQARVRGMDVGRFRQNIRSDNKQKPVGLKQQAPLASSLATSVGELFKPSETTAQEPEPFEFPSLELKTQVAYAQEPVNIIDQTIGDIQKTLGGIEQGNQGISRGADPITVKSYDVPSSLTGVIGRMDMSRSDIQTATSQKQPSLLDGLQIGQQQQQPLLESLITTPITDQFLGSMQRQKQSELYKGIFDMIPRGQELRQLAPTTPITPRPIPQRVMPIVPLFPMYDPVDAAKKRRSKFRKKKTKKTWWQTPENWYEPYYWGGKDQMGAGYVTFTGKEPGKVKKYEKRFFGIGVNDSPFGVRSKWF